MNRYLIPLIAFLSLAGLLYFGLGNNPRHIPSPFIGKAAPEFNLPQLHQPDKNVSPADLKGDVWVLNIWASWCRSCVAEHEVVKAFVKASNLKIVGLNYKDKSDDAKAWLGKLGDPYHLIAVDKEGAAGLDWGVYGVPESFVVDKKGIIRHKVTGPMNAKMVKDELMPLIEALRGES